jgi:hypothetical protein
VRVVIGESMGEVMIVLAKPPYKVCPKQCRQLISQKHTIKIKMPGKGTQIGLPHAQG